MQTIESIKEKKNVKDKYSVIYPMQTAEWN